MFIYSIILSRFDDLHQLSKLLFRWFLPRFFHSSRKLRLATAQRWRYLTSLQWFAGIREAPDLLSYSLAWQVCWTYMNICEPYWTCAEEVQAFRLQWETQMVFKDILVAWALGSLLPFSCLDSQFLANSCDSFGVYSIGSVSLEHVQHAALSAFGLGFTCTWLDCLVFVCPLRSFLLFHRILNYDKSFMLQWESLLLEQGVRGWASYRIQWILRCPRAGWDKSLPEFPPYEYIIYHISTLLPP